MSRYFRILILIIISVIVLSSCNNLRYIYSGDNTNKADSVYVYKNKVEQYKLKPNDVLHIKIITRNEKLNNIFAVDKQANDLNRNNNGGAFYLTGFTVSDSGYIQIPTIGKLHVAGKTMPEVRKLIKEEADKYLTNSILNIKLVSFKISFLGEVNAPSTLYIYQESIDILEALARVGGISSTGDMRNVMVRRPIPDGYKVYRMDLTKRELLESQKFYLYPNDIVIVEPRRGKRFRENTQDFTFILSVVSSTITTFLLVMTLIR